MGAPASVGGETLCYRTRTIMPTEAFASLKISCKKGAQATITKASRAPRSTKCNTGQVGQARQITESTRKHSDICGMYGMAGQEEKQSEMQRQGQKDNAGKHRQT